MNVIVTEHARQRIKERCGSGKKSSAERMCTLALERGIRADEISGDAKRWIDSHKRNKTHEIYIYGDKAYIYSMSRSTAVLVTVMHLPPEIKRIIGRNRSKGKKSKYAS